MTKSRPKAKKTSRAPRKRGVVKAKSRKLDSASLTYSKLLTNPCTGPLIHGPGSTVGGSIARFETDFIVGNGATETCGILHWTPGAYCNLGAGGSGSGFDGLIAAAAATDTAGLTLSGIGNNAPGLTFLRTNASTYRCLAACMQIFWPGTELNRAGFVSGAQATRGLLNGGGANITTATAAGLRAASPIVERMPHDVFEIKWAPNYVDGLFRNPNSTQASEDGHASLLATWSGIPVTTGVRVRLVAVYEWSPNFGGTQVLHSNTSSGGAGAASIQYIRQLLDSRDSNWWNNLGRTAGSLMQAGVALGGGVYNAFVRGPSYPPVPRLEL